MFTEIFCPRSDKRQLTIARNDPSVICGQNGASKVTYAILDLSSTATHVYIRVPSYLRFSRGTVITLSLIVATPVTKCTNVHY